MNLKVGDKAPDFSLPASIGKTITLADLIGRKVVLYFYPKDDTPGCVKEACSFRDATSEIETMGAIVLGVSADDLESHKEFVDKYRLNFPLLSDGDKTTIQDYGVWGEKFFKGKRSVGIRRMTFLISEEGFVEKIWHDVTPENHANEVITAMNL